MHLLRCKGVICLWCLTFSFWFLFVFRYVFFGGGVIHLFTLITSMVLHQWPKTWWNHRKPQYLKCLFLMFCFGACTLTLSPGPHNNRNPKPSTLEIVFVYFIMLLILCWNAYFTVFFEHQPNLPPKSALNKNDNFAQCAKTKPSVLEMFLWKMKTFMLTETHNWKNDKNKIKRRDLKGKTKQETPKNRNNWWKNLSNVIFFLWNKRKETRQERTTKKQGRRNQQESME